MKAPKSCHITSILHSLHWLRITECIEYKLFSVLHTKFSQLPNLHTFLTSSLFNVLAVLALHSSLLLLRHRHHLKITDCSFRYAYLVSGINSLYLFVNLILVPVPPFSTHLFLHSSLLPPGLHSRTFARTVSPDRPVKIRFDPEQVPRKRFMIFLLLLYVGNNILKVFQKLITTKVLTMTS